MDASRELLERSLARKSQELELAQRQLLQYLQDEAVIEEEHVTDLETVCKALHAPGSYRPAVAELEDEVIHLHASLRECNQQLERQALELEQLRPPLASSRLAGSTYQPGLGAKAAELSRGGAPAECGSAEEEAVVLRHALNQALREQDSLKGHLRALMALYGHQDQDLAETCRPRDAERRFGASVGTSAMSDLEQLCAKRDLAALGSSQISGLGSPESGAGSVLVLESSPLDAEAASMIVLESSPLEAGAASLVILQGEASVSSEPNSLNFSPKETIAREFFECETCGQIFRQLAAAEAHEAACQPSADAAEPAADLAPNLEESEAPEPLSEAALRVFERVCRRIVARLQCTAVRSWILWSRSERQMKAVLQASLTRMTHQRLTRCWTSWQLTATEAKYRQSVAHGVMCHIEERNMSSAWHHWRQADATAGQQANLLRKGAAGFSHTKPGLLQAWNSWRSWYCDQRVGRAAAGRMVQQLQWRAYNLWQSVCQAHKAERTALHAAMSWLVRRSLLKAWSSLIVAVQDAKAAMAKLRHAVMRILMLRQASCFQSWQKWSGWRKAVQQGCWAVINKLTHKRLVAAWNLWCSWARHRAYLHTERQLAEASAREAKLTAEREEQRVALMEAAAELKELVVADSQMPDQLDDSYEQLEPDGGTTELESGQNNGASGLNPQVPALLQGRIPLSERMGESAPDVSKEHAKLKAKQQLTEAEAMAVQLEVVSQESRDAVKTGLVCTQLEGAVSEETRDAVKTGLVRTQLEGAVSEETREEIKAELEAQILEAPIESHSHTPDNMASKEETEQATKSPAEQQVDMDPQQSEGDKQVNVWRATGDAAAIMNLKGAFDRGEPSPIGPNEAMGNVTSLVLRFLNEIPDGLLNAQARGLMKNAKGSIELLRDALSDLSSAAKATLVMILQHLARVAINSAVNRMPARKLATCVCMSLGGCQAAAMIELIPAITLMIENHAKLFQTPLDKHPISTAELFRTSADNSSHPPHQAGPGWNPRPDFHVSNRQANQKETKPQDERSLFDAVDKNRDGVIDRSEFEQAIEKNILTQRNGHPLGEERSWKKAAQDARRRIQSLKEQISDMVEVNHPLHQRSGNAQQGQHPDAVQGMLAKAQELQRGLRLVQDKCKIMQVE